MSVKLKFILIGLGIFTLFSCGGGGSDSSTTTEPETTIATLPSDLDSAANNNTGSTGAANLNSSATFEAEILTKINAIRTANGLDALALDSAISDIALPHNIYMAEQTIASGLDYVLSHDNAESRAEEVFALGYNFYGENVGVTIGYPDSQVTDVLADGWEASPGHFANIIGDFTHTGISVYIDPVQGKVYATQIFARETN